MTRVTDLHVGQTNFKIEMMMLQKRYTLLTLHQRPLARVSDLHYKIGI